MKSRRAVGNESIDREYLSVHLYLCMDPFGSVENWNIFFHLRLETDSHFWPYKMYGTSLQDYTHKHQEIIKKFIYIPPYIYIYTYFL